MRDLEAEHARAVEALVEIASGHANNGVPYFAAQLRTMAREALEDMQQMQMASDAKYHDKTWRSW